MQNYESSHVSPESGLEKARIFMQDRIFEFLMQKQPAREIPPNNVAIIVRRLEKGLYKTSTSKEDYMNLDTLESRLHFLVKGHTQRYQQQQQQLNNVTITMMPTPGVPQNADVMVKSAAVNIGSFSMRMGSNQKMPAPGFNNSVDSTMVSYSQSQIRSQLQQEKQQQVAGGSQNSLLVGVQRLSINSP